MESNLKKVLAIFIISAMVLGFAAASQNQTQPQNSGTVNYSANATIQKVNSTGESYLVPLEELNQSIHLNVTSNETNKTVQRNITNSTMNSSEDYQNKTLENNSKENLSNNSKESADSVSKTIVNNTHVTSNQGGAYAPLEKIQNLSRSETVSNNSNSAKLVPVTLSKNGQVQVQVNLPESFNINNIQKQDITENSSSKEVIVSSPIHVTHPLTVYSNIPEISPGQNRSVKIYWVNENKSITPLHFYDTNGDGKYNRVSWIVPHLSTQYFRITVNASEEATNSTGQILLNVSGPSGTQQNPITFNISAVSNYTELFCNLSMKYSKNNTLYLFKNFTINSGSIYKDLSQNISDGDYFWNVSCANSTKTPFVMNSYPGNFTINQNYTVSSPAPLYVLDYNNNILGSPDTGIRITSENSSYNISIKRGNTLVDKNSSISGDIFNLAPYIKQAGAGTYYLQVNFSGSEKPYTVNRNFTVAKINMNANQSTIYKGRSVAITVNVTGLSGAHKVAVMILNYGDGNSSNPVMGKSSSIFPYIYSSTGTKILNATIIFSDNPDPYSVTRTITVENLFSPVITLISPAQNQVINSSNITFSYKANDNTAISNCSLTLYNGSSVGNQLTNPVKKTSPALNTPINVPFANFSQGSYVWWVECSDNQGEVSSANSNFTVDFNPVSFSVSGGSSDYAYESQVEKANQALENFSNRMKSTMTQSQIQALNDLGILGNLTGQKGFLIQLANIEQFFKTNQSSFITDAALRNKTINTNINELYYITSHIPESVTVSQEEQYTKNSITAGMNSIVNAYAQNKNMQISKSGIEKMAKLNTGIQKYISVTADVRNVEIVYPNSTEDITLVTKHVNITNSSFGTIIEFLPAGINSNVVFLTPAKKLNQSVYEISASDLQDGNLIYYTTSPVNPSLMKQSDTVLFEDFSIKGNGITGLSIFGSDGGFPGWIYLIIAFSAAVLFYAGKKIKLRLDLAKWKEEENVNTILQSINKAKDALRENEIETAKACYRKIKELFLLTPKRFRDYCQQEIRMIRKGIDRREIIGFVKEYEKAKSQGRAEDSERLYKEIKSTYKRLPKKDQEKVYNKMFRNDW